MNFTGLPVESRLKIGLIPRRKSGRSSLSRPSRSYIHPLKQFRIPRLESWSVLSRKSHQTFFHQESNRRWLAGWRYHVLPEEPMAGEEFSQKSISRFEKQRRACADALEGIFVCIPFQPGIPTDFYHVQMIIGLLRENHFSSSNPKGKGSQLAADADSEEEEDDEIQTVDQNVGWAYIGSHNFTPSAWGTLSGSSFNPVLNVSMGVAIRCSSFVSIPARLSPLLNRSAIHTDHKLRSRRCISAQE